MSLSGHGGDRRVCRRLPRSFRPCRSIPGDFPDALVSSSHPIHPAADPAAWLSGRQRRRRRRSGRGRGQRRRSGASADGVDLPHHRSPRPDPPHEQLRGARRCRRLRARRHLHPPVAPRIPPLPHRRRRRCRPGNSGEHGAWRAADVRAVQCSRLRRLDARQSRLRLGPGEARGESCPLQSRRPDGESRARREGRRGV